MKALIEPRACLRLICTMGSPPPAAHRRVRLHGARVCEAVQGAGCIRRHLECAGRAVTRLDGLVDHRSGVAGRPRNNAGGVRVGGQHTDGRRAPRGNAHGASALWVQFDQASRRDAGRGAVRAARLRDRFAVYRVSCGSRPGRPRATRHRQCHWSQGEGRGIR
jgi:hypothetical protein